MPTLDQTDHTTAERRPGAGSRVDTHERPRRRGARGAGSAAVATFQALLAEESPAGADLLAPPIPARHVARPRLLRRLQGAGEASVILLAAPAGYGKSTLLSDWVRHEERPVAWLTLSALDNDPEVLLERLAHALTQLAAPWQEPETDAAASTPGGIDLARLPAPLRSQAATLNAIGCDRLLVLDDVQNLRSPDAMRILAELIGAGCARLQVAVASRSEPSLGLGRLRASGRLMQLGPDDLEMTADEARGLLVAAGLELDEPDLIALVDYTEGWAAGLFLAAVLLRSRPDAGVGALETIRDAAEVDEYVREEILAPLPAAQRVFLTRTSVLPWLSPGLCDSVLETKGSGELMLAVANRSLMVTPQQGAPGSYRCHALVRDVLRRGLERREPEEVSALHARASVWLSEHEDFDGAIDHAVAARDAGRAGELVWSQGTRYIAGMDGRLSGWLAALGDDQVAQSARLSLAAAFEALGRGDAVACERWGLRAAAAMRRDGEGAVEPHAGDRAMTAAVSLTRAAGAPPGMPEMAAEAASACELLDQDSPTRPLACLLRGVALQLLGESTDGRTALEEAVHGNSEPTIRVEALGLAELGLVDFADGEWEMAAERLARARELLGEHDLEGDPTFAIVYAAAALVASEQGRGDDAKRDLATAGRQLGELGHYMGWYEVQVRTVMARACVRLADVSRARALLAEASRWARRTNRVESLVAALDTAWGEVDDICAAAADGPGLLTIAELRILRFLPSHLSFREIGERLHVSGNTVKTQAHAVYTKLGAGSRSEAVAKAASIGLIDVTIV
jgi:LuxR family transcriptional regulator, maltose regulon positive regulatory protein